jgi:hypothetical protein
VSIKWGSNPIQPWVNKMSVARRMTVLPSLRRVLGRAAFLGDFLIISEGFSGEFSPALESRADPVSADPKLLIMQAVAAGDPPGHHVYVPRARGAFP